MTPSEYHEKHKERFEKELMELLRIPSISTDPAYRNEVRKAADHLKGRMEEAGVNKAEVMETNGHPVVYGERKVSRKAPTVLVYGHYDVQPPDPLDLWETDPFEPEVRDEKIYARGACDDKGQMYMHIKAFEAMVQTDSLPCNVKFLIEGEEEIGSANLADFVENNKSLLKADVVLVSDTAMISNEVPSITTGIRGISYLEVELTGPNRDLHSGIYGGAVDNPANVLCRMIASLVDSDGRIAIPGFYDDVKVPGPDEKEAFERLPFDLEAYKKDLGIREVAGEKGFTTLERGAVRPTLDVNGIWGGYTGEGAKTVIPSKAHAKISMRLVPDQRSDKITQLFSDHFREIAPNTVDVKIIEHHGGDPALTPVDSVGYKAASEAMATTFGVEPIPLRTGGSIPIVNLFDEKLSLRTILMGFGLDSDGIHSPNEKFGLFNYHKGIETIPYFHESFRSLTKGR